MKQTNQTMAPNSDAHKDIPGNPSTAKSANIALNDRSNGKPLKVLSEADWAFWKTNGFIVIKGAVTKSQATHTAEFLWEFEEKSPTNPDSWYTAPRAEMKMKELAGTGMVEVYNHQVQWNNRQMPRVYEAFTDVWGTDKLWVTIDRANLNFPNREGHVQKGFIHWDYDPATKPQNVQGVLALADQTDEDMGGFQCVPWLYQNFEEWIKTQPDDIDPFQPNMEGLEDKIVKVKMEAGDLLIFNSQLAHGIRPNKSKDKVRIAQYISMMPAEEDNETLKQWRINSWRDRIAPEGYAFPGDPRNWEQEKYETAELSELGEKLLGLKAW